MAILKLAKLGLLFIFVAIVGAAAYALMPSAAAPEYATVPVYRDAIELTVLANGMIQASKLVSVGAQESGQIVSLPVELGQKVKKGDLIAQIDSLTQQNNLKTAKAEFKSLQAQVDSIVSQIRLAQLEFNRQKTMLANHRSAQADYDIASANLEVLQAQKNQLGAQVTRAEVNVDSANINLAYTTITAPMDGTVVYLAVELGQTVNAKQNTPTIVELAELDTMTVKVQISEADVIHVQPNQAVYFSILGDQRQRYSTTLKAIEPGPTSMNGNDINMSPDDGEAIYYNALFDIKNLEQKLRIGMTAEVSIVLDKAENALLVPSQILKKKIARNTYLIEVLSGDDIERREVKVGINNRVQAEVLEGLKENELIVLASSEAAGKKMPQRGMRPMRMPF